MGRIVSLTIEDAVGAIQIDNPPLNMITHPFMAELREMVDAFESDRNLAALVIYCAGRGFVVGADLAMLDDPDFDASGFNATLARIENADRPVIASLHGMVFGGGLELALACHYRVADRETRLALPEVLVGILPGSLGTQRLPRLIPVETALEMMLGGKPISARAARELGLVDELASGAAKEAGIAYARGLLARGAGPRPTRAGRVDVVKLPNDYFEKLLAETEHKKPYHPAPRAIVRCVAAGARLGFAEGEALEAQLFNECRLSPQARALRHLFFAEREAAKLPGLMGERQLRPIGKIGIVGAGTMGGGIAMNFANVGIAVVIVESSQTGLEIVRGNYEATVARGRLTSAEMAERLARLAVSLNYDDLADCDLVIEAVFEDLALKKQVIARLGRTCKPGAVIASNTSTLNLDILADASSRARDVVGMHFFSPANVMRLVEVVRGARTAPDVLATALQLSKKIGKVPVVSGVCYGFIGNRMAEPYMREAEFLLMEGASPTQIDAAVEDIGRLGLAMGPCRMLDMAGVDVGAKTVIEYDKAGGLPPDKSYRAVVRRLYELGRFGQKAGWGYYRYEGRRPFPEPDTDRLCAALARENGIARRDDIGPEEIVERLVYPLINEGTRILEEGIAYRPGDIDVVWTAGYGFPDHRGGPMFMASEIGYGRICERLEHYGRVRGNSFGYWTPSALLRRLAQE